MAKKKPQNKGVKGHGHINVSNVNSENSQCITLTYSISGLKTLGAASKLVDELDDLHDEDTTTNLEIQDWGTEEEVLKLKYKTKTCQDEVAAHTVKKILDKHLKKKGGQTTLDETG